jgi:hypothetical protein
LPIQTLRKVDLFSGQRDHWSVKLVVNGGTAIAIGSHLTITLVMIHFGYWRLIGRVLG